MKVKNTYMLYTDKLQGEFKDTFNKIEVFSVVGENSPTEEKRDEILMQVLDMLLEAQQEGASPSKVVGDDIESFCTELFSSSLAKSPFFEIFNSIKRLMFVVLFFSGTGILVNFEEQGIWTSYDDSIIIAISSFTLGYILIGIIMKAFRKNIFKKKKIGAGILAVSLLISSIFTVAASVFIGNHIKIEIKNWILATVSISYLIVFYVYKYGKKVVSREKAIKKDKNDDKVEIANLFDSQAADAIIKNFHKKNERKVKKGKEPISEEQFMKKFIKEGSEIRSIITKAVYIIIFILFLANMLSDTMINIFSGFKVKYLVDLAVEIIFIFIYYKFMLFLYNSFTVRERIARRCIKENKSIFELES